MESQETNKAPIWEHKVFMLLTVLLLLSSIAFLIYKSSTTGLLLDIDLKGGTQVSFDYSGTVSEQEIENLLSDYDADVRIARGISGTTVLITVGSTIDADNILDTLRDNDYAIADFSVQSIGPVLGSSFFRQAQIAMLAAFIFMAVTVFIVFRKPLPSFYVVLAGFADIVEALAISQFIGIELSLATFAALLLLIGYSVDTDVLLTTRVLKGDGTTRERIRGAMKTGVTMTGTAIVALLALFLIGGSNIIAQIASVLLIGLVFDMPNTWFLNAGLLRWYVERKSKTV